MTPGQIRYATNCFAWNTTYNKGIPELTNEEIIARAEQAGADGIEMDPEGVTAEMLARHGMVLAGTSVGGSLFADWSEDIRDEVVSTAAASAELGGYYLFFTTAPLLGWDGGWGEAGAATDELLQQAGERLNDMGRRVREFGLDFVFHNHAAVPQGLDAEMRMIKHHTAPECVGLFLDIGWAYAAGGDPVTIIRESGSRIGGFHIRNQAGVVPTQTLTEGEIDMAAVAAAIKEIGYDGWVSLELWHCEDTEVTKSMMACHEESLAYLRELLG